MAATASAVVESSLPGGGKIVAGRITMDASYATSGEVFDLSAYFSGSPIVCLTGDDGYVLQHNRGTAAAGLVLAYEAGADAEFAAL